MNFESTTDFFFILTWISLEAAILAVCTFIVYAIVAFVKVVGILGNAIATIEAGTCRDLANAAGISDMDWAGVNDGKVRTVP